MIEVIGDVHITRCICGGHLVARTIGEYGPAIVRHQQTAQHRAWADGPAFEQWQNQGTMEGQNDGNAG